MTLNAQATTTAAQTHAAKRGPLSPLAHVRIDATTLYYIALALYIVRGFPGELTIYEAEWISTFNRVLKFAALGLLLFKMCLQRYTLEEIIVIGVAGFAALFSWQLSDYQTVVFLYFFIVAAKDVDMKVVAKITLVLTVVYMLVVIYLTDIGLLESYTRYVTSESRSYLWDSSGDNAINLWAFRHHNYIGRHVLVFYMCYVLLRYDKFKIWDLAVTAFAFWFCYSYIKTRTAALIILFIVAMVLVLKFFGSLSKHLQGLVARVAVYGVMVFSVVFSFYACLNYSSDSSIYVMLDDLLTTRLSAANSIYGDYGFSLLGQEVVLVSTLTAAEEGIRSIVLDNAYMHMFIRLGAVVGVLMSVGYLVAAQVSLANGDYCTALLIAAWAICGISETWLFDISSNPLPILVSLAVYGRRTRVPQSARAGITPRSAAAGSGTLDVDRVLSSHPAREA